MLNQIFPTASQFEIDQQQLQQQQQQQPLVDFDDLYIDVVSPSFQSFDDELWKLIEPPQNKNLEPIEPPDDDQYVFPSRSLEILKKYGSRQRRLNPKEVNHPSYEIQQRRINSTLPAEKIIRLAAQNFIDSNSGHPYAGSILGPFTEDSREVHLVHNLLSAAENVGDKQYERGVKLLRQCDKMSCNSGSPVERLVFYFGEALYEKIDRETERITPKGLGKKIADPLEALKCQDSILISFCKELPLARVTSFAAIQALVEHLGDAATKVHIIDLDIKNGLQCATLMQALSSGRKTPIEHLKVTAVGVGIKTKEKIQETGRRLTTFAQSLDFKFSFNVVVQEDILGLNIGLFEFAADEAVAVYASYTLTTMIGYPDRLRHMMELMRSINPCVMIVTEIEANCNSPFFVDRFVEALFFYAAFFDSLAECMKDEKTRRDAESTCFNSSIRNIVGTEGKERKVRHVSIDVWRAFFAQFDLFEIELSTASLCMANLVLNNFTCGNSITFDMNGKCLTICWKGTPLTSLSAWKFQ